MVPCIDFMNFPPLPDNGVFFPLMKIVFIAFSRVFVIVACHYPKCPYYFPKAFSGSQLRNAPSGASSEFLKLALSPSSDLLKLSEP